MMAQERMTVEEARRAGLLPKSEPLAPVTKQGRNRGNVPTEVDGIKFPSKKEARRWQELKLLGSGEGISRLRRQVTFPLIVKGWPVYEEGYRADFTYYELEGGEWFFVVEDCKGYRTEIYENKKRLMKAIYGIEIRES